MEAYPHRKPTEIWSLLVIRKGEPYIETQLAAALNMKERQVAHRLNRPRLIDLPTVKKLAEILNEPMAVLIFHYGCGLGQITMEDFLAELQLDASTLEFSGDQLTICKAKQTEAA